MIRIIFGTIRRYVFICYLQNVLKIAGCVPGIYQFYPVVFKTKDQATNRPDFQGLLDLEIRSYRSEKCNRGKKTEWQYRMLMN